MAAFDHVKHEEFKGEVDNMARDTQSIVKMSRREGYALHPKAHKALVKRSTIPGEHGRSRQGKSSQYALQLREKQKVKRLYGLLERQFSNLMKEASSTKGQSGEMLLQLLERRADNAVYRSGLAPSRRAARQLVTHGHFMLNGRRVDIPSIRLKAGDVLELRDKSKKNEYFKKIDDVSPSPSETPGWMKVNRKKFEISITGLPTREEAEPEINEQLIVEYYSR
jgi:small subunit ribosomal protein S4